MVLNSKKFLPICCHVEEFSPLSLTVLITQYYIFKVLSQVNKLVEVFKDDEKLMDGLVELIHCLHHLHSGAPDLYEPLIKAISVSSSNYLFIIDVNCNVPIDKDY